MYDNKTVPGLCQLQNMQEAQTPEPFFTDTEHRILLAALTREKYICKGVDEGSPCTNGSVSLLSVVQSIERKIYMLQHPQRGGEFMNLIELAAEAAGSAPAEAMEMSHPIVTEKKSGSKRKIWPFTIEELDGYRMPGTGRKNLRIVCGMTVSLDANRLTVANNGQEDSFLIQGKYLDKSKDLVPGIRVTAVISGNDCLDLKLGPFFGVTSWKLFYGSNQKSVTEFLIK